MRTVAVLGTGGTIATRVDSDGVGRAADSGETLVSRVAHGMDVEVTVHDVFVKNSFLITPENMVELARAARRVLVDQTVLGVVVTHGTDTTEESAYLLDLVHADDRPVVVTGAQRPADASDADGPRNLADAIAVAADPKARGLGVLVVFDGLVFAARGTRKTHTLRPAAFSTPDVGPLGYVREGRLHLSATPLRSKPLDLDAVDLADVRVDIATFYPGADATALRAFAEAGATGIVLQASGAGNANPDFARAVKELTAAGVVVCLSTRVDAGPVAALYGDGGGVDLVRSGAIPLGTLRPPQGRVLLALLLGSLRDPNRVRAELPRLTEI